MYDSKWQIELQERESKPTASFHYVLNYSCQFSSNFYLYWCGYIEKGMLEETNSWCGLNTVSIILIEVESKEEFSQKEWEGFFY